MGDGEVRLFPDSESLGRVWRENSVSRFGEGRATVCMQSLLCGRQISSERQVDIDHLSNFEDEDAGVFQSPLNVRNIELRFGRESCPFDVNLHGYCQVMRSAVKGEDAGHLNGGIAGWGDSSLITPGHEGDV